MMLAQSILSFINTFPQLNLFIELILSVASVIIFVGCGFSVQKHFLLTKLHPTKWITMKLTEINSIKD